MSPSPPRPAPARTRLLVSVRDAGEARLAAQAGADLVDAKDPDAGALGALPLEAVGAIVAAVAEASRPAAVSAVAGELGALGPVVAAARSLAARHVGMVKVALPRDLVAAPALASLWPALVAIRTPLVAVLFAEDGVDGALVELLARAGFSGAMVDTRAKGGRRLLDHADPERLAAFTATCARFRMISGLAGSLALDDIAVLAPLGATYLGFRGGLCRSGDRRDALDGERVAEAKRRLDAVPGETAPSLERAGP